MVVSRWKEVVRIISVASSHFSEWTFEFTHWILYQWGVVLNYERNWNKMVISKQFSFSRVKFFFQPCKSSHLMLGPVCMTFDLLHFILLQLYGLSQPVKYVCQSSLDSNARPATVVKLNLLICSKYYILYIGENMHINTSEPCVIQLQLKTTHVGKCVETCTAYAII